MLPVMCACICEDIHHLVYPSWESRDTHMHQAHEVVNLDFSGSAEILSAPGLLGASFHSSFLFSMR